MVSLEAMMLSHSQHIITCKHGRNGTYDTRGEIAELFIKLEPSLYSKYIWSNQKGKHMLFAQKSTLWSITTTALEITVQYITGVEIYDQQI